MNLKSHLFVLIYCFLLIYHIANGQKIDNQSLISNKKIQFEIARISLKWVSDGIIEPSKYIIEVKDIDKFRNYLFTLNKADIIALLTNPKSDWATNLILYDIFGKDAFLLFLINRREWVAYGKEQDIEYWKKKLQ